MAVVCVCTHHLLSGRHPGGVNGNKTRLYDVRLPGRNEISTLRAGCLDLGCILAASKVLSPSEKNGNSAHMGKLGIWSAC
eukprot:scaffold10393_cov19-Tisochrysis_lutea.AAC.2